MRLIGFFPFPWAGTLPQAPCSGTRPSWAQLLESSPQAQRHPPETDFTASSFSFALSSLYFFLPPSELVHSLFLNLASLLAFLFIAPVLPLTRDWSSLRGIVNRSIASLTHKRRFGTVKSTKRPDLPGTKVWWVVLSKNFSLLFQRHTMDCWLSSPYRLDQMKLRLVIWSISQLEKHMFRFVAAGVGTSKGRTDALDRDYYAY